MSNNQRQQPVSELVESSLSNLRTLIDVNTIIGDPITTNTGVTIIPVSKVSFGYGSGGADLSNEIPEKFAGGSGAGVTLQPIAFLVINQDKVELLQLTSAKNTADRIVNAGAGALDKIIDLIPKKDSNTEEPKEYDDEVDESYF